MTSIPPRGWRHTCGGFSAAALFLIAATLPAAVAQSPKAEAVGADAIREILASLQPDTLDAAAKDPAQFEQLVRALVLQRVVLREALAKQWDQRPDVVEKIKRARDTAIRESYLESKSRPPDDYPGEEDLNKAYEAAKPGLAQPRSYRLAQLFIVAGKDGGQQASAAVPDRVARLAREAQGSDDVFAAAARANSEDTKTAAQGGELGWVSGPQIQPEIREQIERLPLHGTSAPVRLQDGWHIFHVLDIREPYTPTPAQVRDKLIADLRSAKQKENARLYLSSLLQANPLAIKQPDLQRILTELRKK